MNTENVADFFQGEYVAVIKDYWMRWVTASPYTSRSCPPRYCNHLDSVASAEAKEYPVNERWYEIKETLTGDHVGSGAVGASNRQVMVDYCESKDSKIEAGQWAIVGDILGAESLYLRGDVDDSGVLSMLSSLADYPVLDETQWSEAQNEAQNEAWSNWAAYEFWSAVIKVHVNDGDHAEEISEHDDFDSALREMFDDLDPEWTEEHDSMYVNVESVAKCVTAGHVFEFWSKLT